MAKIRCSYACAICNEKLNFPNDVGMIQFQILQMQFYVDHDRCENLAKQIAQQPKKVEKKKKK